MRPHERLTGRKRDVNDAMLTPIQNAHQNPILEVRDGQCVLRMVNQAGNRIEKLVSWESVREAATAIPVDSGWLPLEVIRWGTGSKGEWVVAFIPPGPAQLELTKGTPGEGEEIERITAPLPGMVLFGGGVRYWIWAVKGDRVNPHHEVCRCPLPNVMQDASICWGLVKPPEASPRTVLRAWELFIKSTFNNHAASGKSKKHREDVRVLLKELAEGPVERYPVDDLVRQVDHTGITLDRVLRDFFGSGEMPE
jgi:PRTRC genetic system protein B